MVKYISHSISISNIKPIGYSCLKNNNENIKYPLSEGKNFYFLLNDIRKNIMNISYDNFIELQKRYKDSEIEILDIYIEDRNTNGSIFYMKDLPKEWYFKSIANIGTNIKYGFKNNEKQRIIDYLIENKLGINIIEKKKELSEEEKEKLNLENFKNKMNNLKEENYLYFYKLEKEYYKIKEHLKFNENQYGKTCSKEYILVFLKHIQDAIENKEFSHYEKNHNVKVNLKKIVEELRKEDEVIIRYNNEKYAEYELKRKNKIPINFYEFKIIENINKNEFITKLFCTKIFTCYYFRFKYIDKKWNVYLVERKTKYEFVDFDEKAKALELKNFNNTRLI